MGERKTLGGAGGSACLARLRAQPGNDLGGWRNAPRLREAGQVGDLPHGARRLAWGRSPTCPVK